VKQFTTDFQLKAKFISSEDRKFGQIELTVDSD
jgi:hypothetical protein